MEQVRESKRLLVVDDELAITKLLKTLLTRAKYQVVTCNSGADALRTLSQAQFDLLITDSIMPSMTGLELVRTIRGNPTFQEIPILMLTRKSERDDVKNALQAGVTDYVLKPIDEHLLIDKVETSLNKRTNENRLREVSIHGSDGAASVRVEARVVSLRETGMAVRFKLPPPPENQYVLEAPIFSKIGIPVPLFKMTSCELDASKESPLRDFAYLAEFSFVGVGEKELRKIRTWLQQQEIARKK